MKLDGSISAVVTGGASGLGEGTAFDRIFFCHQHWAFDIGQTVFIKSKMIAEKSCVFNLYAHTFDRIDKTLWIAYGCH